MPTLAREWINEGIVEGMQQGMTKGRTEEKRSSVVRMFNEGMNVEDNIMKTKNFIIFILFLV